MNENLDPSKDNLNSDEIEIDKALRPLSFSDFNGQNQVIDNLKIFVQAANERSEALDHTLLHGPPGLGKTTLAHIHKFINSLLEQEFKTGLHSLEININ